MFMLERFHLHRDRPEKIDVTGMPLQVEHLFQIKKCKNCLRVLAVCVYGLLITLHTMGGNRKVPAKQLMHDTHACINISVFPS